MEHGFDISPFHCVHIHSLPFTYTYIQPANAYPNMVKKENRSDQKNNPKIAFFFSHFWHIGENIFYHNGNGLDFRRRNLKKFLENAKKVDYINFSINSNTLYDKTLSDTIEAMQMTYLWLYCLPRSPSPLAYNTNKVLPTPFVPREGTVFWVIFNLNVNGTVEERIIENIDITRGMFLRG